MSAGYQGIVWDYFKDEPRKPKEQPPLDTGPKDMLPPEEQAAKVTEMRERLGGMFGTQ